MSDVIPGIGTAVSAIGDAIGIFNGFHQNHLANKIHPVFNPYQQSEYTKKQLGLGIQLFNGLMPGYNTLKQGIDSSGANFNNNVERNATDSSQALSLQGLSQGMTNNGYEDLQKKQEGYQVDMLGNLNEAFNAMTEEGDKSYQSMLQKYMSDVNTQNNLRKAGSNNIVGGFNDIGSKAIAFGNYQNAGK